MDKLKENIFAIGVVAIGIVLLVLIALLVVVPLGDLSATRATIDTRVNELQNAAKRIPIAIKEVQDFYELEKERNTRALDEAVAFYDALAEPFGLFFDSQKEPPPIDTFVAMYKDRIDGLVSAYREKFKIQAAPDKPEETPPKIDRLEPIDETRIGMAQQEYWMIEDVFNTLNALEVGGLLEISFPGRLSQDRTTYLYRRYKDVTVKLAIPFSKVENFVTHLVSSRVVPLLIEELSIQKAQESLPTYLPLEHSQDFETASAAARVEYDAAIPEPSVVVTLKLVALIWQGVPPEAAAATAAATR